MKCPRCGEEMKKVNKDESSDVKTEKKYFRTTYHCEKDDTWVGVEISQTS